MVKSETKKFRWDQNKMAASVKSFSQQSRFSVLSIDDDEDSDDVRQSKKSGQNGKPNAAKKRNRKKKKVDQTEKAELRELAFGTASGKLKSSSSSKKQQTITVKKTGPQGDAEQWDEWKKADEEFTNEQYKNDLQQAMLQSKLENEKAAEVKIKSTDNEASTDSKKKKKKKLAMSLDQFNQLDGKSGNQTKDDTLGHKEPSSKIASPDTEFFDRVDIDTSKTILKEKIQEEYTKQYIVQNARSALYEKEIKKRDKEITMLRATVAKLKDEAMEAKQRNQQLCNILAQGEMKDKAGILLSLDELTDVKNELLEQINFLNGELEKEKSKSHSLKTELEKYQTKASKHK